MIERSRAITFTFDDQEIAAHDGETIAAALMRTGQVNIRTSPYGEGSGVFCGMGICQECVVEVDGKKVESCRTTVADGMTVRKARYV